MCFIIAKEEPTFGEMARDMHHSHVAEVRERSARLAAEERAERMAERLGQQDADLLDSRPKSAAQAKRDRTPSPPDSPPKGRPTLQASPSRARRLLRLPTFSRSHSR